MWSVELCVAYDMCVYNVICWPLLCAYYTLTHTMRTHTTTTSAAKCATARAYRAYTCRQTIESTNRTNQPNAHELTKGKKLKITHRSFLLQNRAIIKCVSVSVSAAITAAAAAAKHSVKMRVVIRRSFSTQKRKFFILNRKFKKNSSRGRERERDWTTTTALSSIRDKRR